MTRAGYEIFIPGIPAPQGSKRYMGSKGGKGVMVESSKRVAPWRHDVRESLREIVTGRLEGPLRVEMAFYLPRPKSHYRTGKRSDELKDSAPSRPCAHRDDVEKLARAVSDAVTSAGAWSDDGQVCSMLLDKLYADECPPGVHLFVAVL